MLKIDFGSLRNFRSLIYCESLCKQMVEQRGPQTEVFAGVTWILALIVTFIVIAFGEFMLIGK
jgi:hypothetical protein